MTYTSGPQPFWHQGPVLWKKIFPPTMWRGAGGGEGGAVWMIQEHNIYCELNFYYYYMSSTSDHQVLDPGGWGPLS